MREYREKRIEVGYNRSSKKIFDEIEYVTAQFIRAGWSVDTTVLDETLEFIDVIFVREINLEAEEIPHEV